MPRRRQKKRGLRGPRHRARKGLGASPISFVCRAFRSVRHGAGQGCMRGYRPPRLRRCLHGARRRPRSLSPSFSSIDGDLEGEVRHREMSARPDRAAVHREIASHADGAAQGRTCGRPRRRLHLRRLRRRPLTCISARSFPAFPVEDKPGARLAYDEGRQG